MPREAEAKDMSVLQETEGFKSALEKDQAFLKDYLMGAVVKMSWNLNAEANRDRMFMLEINGEKAILDLEELYAYLRVV